MDTRHQIMKAATYLIAHKGFKATSIREIGMLSSVNLAMIYYYFNNKSNLFDSILHDGTQKIMEKMQRILTGRQTEIKKIFSLIDMHVDYVSNEHELTRIFFQEELVKSSPAIQELRQMDYQMFENIIKAGQGQGGFVNDVNPTLLYSTIVGTIQQFMVKQLAQNIFPDNYGLSTPFSKPAEELSSYLKNLCNKILLK